MKYWFRLISVLLLVFFTFCSCEKVTYVYYFLYNQSSTEVVINGSDYIHSIGLNQIIPINEKTLITHWSKRGIQKDLFEPSLIFGQDLLITNSLGDTLQKDYKSLSNWQSSVSDKGKTASHNYILVVMDSDF